MSMPPRFPVRRSVLTIAAAVLSVGMLTGCGPVADFVGRSVDRAIDEARDAVRGDAPDSPAGGISDEGDTTMDELAIGDCVNDEALSSAEVSEVYSVDVVPCDEPHDSEVFGFASYSDGPLPDDDELFRIAEDGCIELFDDYVGTDYESSSLEVWYYAPTPESWKYGDRDAICEVYDMDLDDLVGSVKNSGL